MKEPVKFKDLSGVLKYAVIGGFIYLTVLTLTIILGALAFFLLTV